MVIACQLCRRKSLAGMLSYLSSSQPWPHDRRQIHHERRLGLDHFESNLRRGRRCLTAHQRPDFLRYQNCVPATTFTWRGPFRTGREKCHLLLRNTSPQPSGHDVASRLDASKVTRVHWKIMFISGMGFSRMCTTSSSSGLAQMLLLHCLAEVQSCITISCPSSRL